MHSAPSVSYPVGRSRLGGAILWAFWAAGACCACAWCYQNGSVGWRTALVAIAFVLSTAALVHALRTMRERVARWDGATWSLSGRVPMGMAAASVVVDLQSVLLVRMTEAGRATQWLWLDKAAMPERWSALRRAVYCRAPGPDAVASPAVTASPAHRTPDLSA